MHPRTPFNLNNPVSSDIIHSITITTLTLKYYQKWRITMKNITYILPYLQKGGTETHVLELIKGFINEYEITLIAPPGSRLKDFQNYIINYLPFTDLNTNFLKGIRELKQNLNNLNSDLVHIHAAHEFILFSRLFAVNIPRIFTVHGYHQESSSQKLDYKLCSFFNNLWSEKTIAISQAEKEVLLNAGINKEQLTLIHNGISLPGNYSKNNLSPKYLSLSNSNKTILGTIARLEKSKGLKYLIDSVNKINNDNYHLLILGSGSQEQKLKKQVKKLNLNRNITFTGFVHNVHDFLEIMDIFILPSLEESFGLVSAEAMAHKLPVIATRTGGIPEIVDDKTTGFLVPPQNSKILAAKISKLIKNKKQAAQMGTAGFQRYQKYFTLKQQIEKTKKIYEQVF